MATRNNVRTHTRKTAAGGTTTVRQHTRTGRPKRRGLVTPGHAWNLTKRAVKAGRRKKKVTAAVLGGLALIELVAWLALEGAGLMLATAAVLALGVAWVAAAAGGIDLQ